MSLNKMSKPNRSNEVVWRDEGDKAILYDTRNGKTYVMNPTAKLIWSLCDGNHDLVQISGLVISKFATNNQDITEDVSKTVKRLHDLGLLIPSQSPIS